jgi:hypothetical protein
MALKLVETKILADAVQMRYADHADPLRAVEFCEFRVKLEGLTHPLVQGKPQPLGNPQEQFVAEVQLAALRYIRDVIGGETQHLQQLSGRIR